MQTNHSGTWVFCLDYVSSDHKLMQFQGLFVNRLLNELGICKPETVVSSRRNTTKWENWLMEFACEDINVCYINGMGTDTA